MERLTDRTEDGLICLNNNGNCGFIEQLIKSIGKLTAFEDFMEANKFESIEELQNALNGKFENISKSYLDEIKVYTKALQLACEHIEAYSDSCYYCPRKQYCDEKCELDSGNKDCIDWLMNYFKKGIRYFK